MSGITHLVNHIHLPRFVRAKQFFPHNELNQEQIARLLDAGFQRKEIREKIWPEMRIASPAAAAAFQILRLLFDTWWSG